LTHSLVCVCRSLLLALLFAMPTPAAIASADSHARATLVAEVETEQAFRNQIRRLVEVGYPKTLGMTTEQFRLMLEPLSKLINVGVRKTDKNNLPFLIVIPGSLMKIGTQFDLIEFENGKRGSATYREIDEIRDAFLTPEQPYLIFDIDLGIGSKKIYRYNSVRAARELLSRNGRRGLTLAEAIALATQYPKIVSKQTIYATASFWRYDNTEAIPRIGSTFGYPFLTYLFADYFGQGPLPASCRGIGHEM